MLITPAISSGYVVINPVTGREVVIDEDLASETYDDTEYLSQNIAISPGDFVRGRASNIRLKYPQAAR